MKFCTEFKKIREKSREKSLKLKGENQNSSKNSKLKEKTHGLGGTRLLQTFVSSPVNFVLNGFIAIQEVKDFPIVLN